jgi:tetratricopeptide (TPR) repeat protein
MSYDDELDDDGELAERHRKAARNRTVGLVAGVVLLGAIGLGAAAKSCGGRKRDADRLTLRTAAAKFEASPADEGLANALAAEYEARGKKAEADKVRERHAAAVGALAGGREKELRARLAAAPDDEQALGQLVELLGRNKDLAGAKAQYVAFVERNPTPKRQASLGSWLWRNGFAEDAARTLTAALKGTDDAYAHAYLGLALFDLGRKREARAEIERAQEAGAEMDVLNQRRYEIDQALGSAPEPKVAPARPPKKARPKGP